MGALLSASGYKWGLYLGRLLSGIGVGVTSSTVPVLLSEIAPDSQRGLFTCLHPVFHAVGVLAVAMISYGFVTYVEHGWQYVQALAILPCSVMISK